MIDISTTKEPSKLTKYSIIIAFFALSILVIYLIGKNAISTSSISFNSTSSLNPNKTVTITTSSKNLPITLPSNGHFNSFNDAEFSVDIQKLPTLKHLNYQITPVVGQDSLSTDNPTYDLSITPNLTVLTYKLKELKTLPLSFGTYRLKVQATNNIGFVLAESTAQFSIDSSNQ